MNTKQPVIYSEAEYERFIGALWLNTKLKGGKPKSYEAYVKSKTESTKWEDGMLVWDISQNRMKKITDRREAYNPNDWLPPTKDQLADYERQQKHDPKSIPPEKNPVREIGSSAMWDGHLYFSLGNNPALKVNRQEVTVIATGIGSVAYEIYTASGTNHYVNANQLSDLPDEEGDPANTCSPSMVSPADVEEFLASRKAEKENQKPGHEYKAKDMAIWDGMVCIATESAEKISDPCEVDIIEVLSTTSVFDYEIRHNDIGWCVHANQLTPIPDKKPFRVDNIVVFGITNALGKIINIYHEDGNSHVRLTNGEKRVWAISDLTHANQAQVDKFYTVTIDGEVIRFYRYLGDIWHVNENGNRWILVDRGLTAHLVLSLINQHYKHLILSVDDVEKMIPPVGKGGEK